MREISAKSRRNHISGFTPIFILTCLVRRFLVLSDSTQLTMKSEPFSADAFGLGT